MRGRDMWPRANGITSRSITANPRGSKAGCPQASKDPAAPLLSSQCMGEQRKADGVEFKAAPYHRASKVGVEAAGGLQMCLGGGFLQLLLKILLPARKGLGLINNHVD